MTTTLFFSSLLLPFSLLLTIGYFQMEANEDVLVSEQATAILKRTGMIDLYSRAAAHQSKQVEWNRKSLNDYEDFELLFLHFDNWNIWIPSAFAGDCGC